MDKDSINNKLNARYKRLNNLSESIEKKLLILPEGKIRIQHRENSDYYYYVDKESNDNGMTVSVSNAAFVQITLPPSSSSAYGMSSSRRSFL